jgi:SpoVK/Ycf46/Vps4 family AAA+-type ATPase
MCLNLAYYSGADLAQVFREAGKVAMREIMTELEKSNPKALEEEDQIPHIVVHQRHLLSALCRVTPSVSVNIAFFHLFAIIIIVMTHDPVCFP